MMMAEEKKQALTPEELEQQDAEAMPERDEMSLINANLAVPVNLGAALNVLSDGSTAAGDATQTDPIDQATT
jgi:hypothetical protein